MAVPTFVSIGTLASGTSTAASPALPASRVNGNVLIAFVTMNTTKVFSLSGSPGGWTLLSPQATASGTAIAVAWRIVDGSEAACPFVWTGSHAFQARCMQYTGNDTTSPIGNMDTNTGQSGNTTGTIGVFASRANSGVAAFMNWQSVGTTSTPAGWSSRNNDTLTAAGTIASKTFTAGLVNVGDSVNGSFGNPGVAWSIAIVEILSPSPAATGTIGTTLFAPTQSIAITEKMPSTAAQTLIGITQDFEAITAFNSTISMVLPNAIAAQEADVVVNNNKAHIDQTLSGITMAASANTNNSTISTLLKGPTQVLNGLMVPNAAIDQTLFGISQALVAGIPPKATIDTTLFAPTQAAAVVEKIPSTISTLLHGFTQESDEIVALNTTVNMILCAKNANASAVGINEQSHAGNFIGHPSINASASQAGNLVVAVLQSTATGSAGHAVTSIANVPGQPAWQFRSSKQGSQSGSAVGLEVWYFISNSAFGSTACLVNWNGNLSAWENVCVEYTNVDTAQPWDSDPSLPASTAQNSLTVTSTPSIGGLSTRADHSMLVGFYGANTTATPSAAAGFTRDYLEQIVSGGHTSGTVAEVSKSVNLPQSGVTVAMGSGSSAWCFIADAIRPQQLTTAMTQDVEIDVNPAALVDVVLTLQTIMQSANVVVSPAAIINQTFIGFVQEEIDVASTACTIDQTLLGFSTEADIHETLPGNTIAGQTAQTFEGFTQRIDVVSYAGVIDQTLPGFVQEFDATEELPSDIVEQSLFGIQMEADVVEIIPTAIAQTLPGIVQEADVVESIATAIDQTLPGIAQEADIVVSPVAAISQTFEGLTQRADVAESIPVAIDQTLLGISQELDAVESIPVAIDQTLLGISQEFDAVETITAAIDMQLAGFGQEADVIETIPTQIDQTLLGISQDFEGMVEEPEGVIAIFVDQVFPGFQQRIDVSALKIDIAAELMGFTQRITCVAPTKRKVRDNHAAIMPSKEMPIHPGELEFFRRKVYGRAVDAMVPPPVTARYNLTTQRYPTSRISVDRTPLGKKPS